MLIKVNLYFYRSDKTGAKRRRRSALSQEFLNFNLKLGYTYLYLMQFFWREATTTHYFVRIFDMSLDSSLTDSHLVSLV